MKTTITKEELLKFEGNIAEIFDAGKIKAPVHSDNGNEDQILEVFKDIKEDDYVCGTWRMHYKCLLKGVPPHELMKDVIMGKSITLCYREHNIFSSAIVGGIIPIALGIAMDIKRKGTDQKVFCFLGDMASMTGAFHEAYTYSYNHKLPIVWVIEDNNKSVCTNTQQVWGQENVHKPWDEPDYKFGDVMKWGTVYYYEYKSKWPHAGFGKRIQF